MAAARINPISETLEEIIQCPVCLEMPTSTSVIVQCTTGHHICTFCRNRLEVCPTCKFPFSGTRNYVVEHLGNKFEFIKAFLDEAEQAIYNKVERTYASVHTQTERPSIIATKVGSTQTEKSTSEPSTNNTNLPPVVAKGSYPCRVGSCTVEDSYANLIGHINQFHKDTHYKFPPATNGVFSEQLIVDNTLPRDFDYTFLIRNMGLFFVHMTIHFSGNFMVHVQLANSAQTSDLFNYEIGIGDGTTVKSYNRGKVSTCREPVDPENMVDIPERVMLRLTDGRPFTCTIVIRSGTRTTPQAVNKTSQSAKKTPQPAKRTPQPANKMLQLANGAPQPAIKTPQLSNGAPRPPHVTPMPVKTMDCNGANKLHDILSRIH